MRAPSAPRGPGVSLHASTTLVVVCIVLWAVSALLLRRHAPHARFTGTDASSTLFTDERGSCLLLAGRVKGVAGFYLLDTGYAGPPVLNTLYLHVLQRSPDLRSQGGSDEHASARRTMRAMRSSSLRADADADADADVDADALQRYMRETGSIDFTAGCRVRLMGISATTERHSDLILSDELLFLAPEGRFASPRANTDLPRGDVLVTNRIANTPHILTADYIRHHAPCHLAISQARVEWCVPNARFLYLTSVGGFANVPCAITGGAYIVVVAAGGGEFRCVLDTGSESCLTIGSKAAARMSACVSTGRTTSSSGVGGRTACSRIVSANVRLAGRTLATCPVSVSSFDDSSVDGFVGMGVLRCFDWLLTARAVFARPNGARHVGADDASATDGACDAPSVPACGV